MNVVTQFIKNIIYQSFNDFFLRIIAAVTGIIVIRWLPKEAYGLLALILAIVGFLNLVSNLGYPTMIIKSISKYYATDVSKAASYYRFIFKIYGLIAVTVAITLFLVAPLIAKAYSLPQATSIIRIASLLFFLMCLYSLNNWTFVGLNQIKPFFLKVGIPKELFTLLMVVVFLYLGYAIKGVIVAQILGLVLALLLAILLVSKRLKGKSADIDRKWIIRGALELTPSKLAYSSTVYMDVIIIGVILSTPLLASYRACLAIVTIFYGLFPIGTFIMPTFHQLSRERALGLLNDIIKCVIMFALPMMFFLTTFSKEIITLLFGSKYLDSIFLLSLFSFMLMGQFAESVFVGTMNYLGRFRAMSKIWVFVAILNIVLLIILTKLIGLKGAVFATIALHYLLVVLMGYDINRNGMPLKGKAFVEILLIGTPLLINILGLLYLSFWFKLVLFAATIIIYFVILKVRGIFSDLKFLKEVRLFSIPTVENKSP